ncbi:aspartate/glutamate racemase family protein [Alkaliphilus peptidifermentans]|uniref:Aspartate/glutamate racemase family protein n=1 Tax=Alkaliphilus peptidifermentans DSM 18978 TaxID=1120976 RepID=A0A1G5JT78_9FIRM|nr:aspartate/glutamate racemase family protein [Alkaliphilus peptidifermentans]SCY90958.1 hypothetical protein SAMN03080606_02999 [Alkaliphilus peptidifermentans DSM 18978]
MIYYAKPGQVSYGEAIGIILLDSVAPFIPGDVANATTYSFPVRFRRVPGLTVKRILSHDLTALDAVLEAGLELKREGVRAITSDCGFMALYQKQLVDQLKLPVFLSSLLQVPFMERLIAANEKIGIITVNSNALSEGILELCGAALPGRIAIQGLQNASYFSSAFIEEVGELDFKKVETEVVAAATSMIKKDPTIKLILLECSVLPPYGSAIQMATGLPVFDFVTMINYIYSVVVKNRVTGFM